MKGCRVATRSNCPEYQFLNIISTIARYTRRLLFPFGRISVVSLVYGEKQATIRGQARAWVQTTSPPPATILRRRPSDAGGYDYSSSTRDQRQRIELI